MIETIAVGIGAFVLGCMLTFVATKKGYIESKINYHIFNDDVYKISIEPNRELENYISEYVDDFVEKQYITRHKNRAIVREVKITPDEWSVEMEVFNQADFEEESEE